MQRTPSSQNQHLEEHPDDRTGFAQGSTSCSQWRHTKIATPRPQDQRPRPRIHPNPPDMSCLKVPMKKGRPSGQPFLSLIVSNRLASTASHRAHALGITGGLKPVPIQMLSR